MSTLGTGVSSLAQTIRDGPGTLDRELAHASWEAQTLLQRLESDLEPAQMARMLRHLRQDHEAAKSYLLIENNDFRRFWVRDELSRLQ